MPLIQGLTEKRNYKVCITLQASVMQKTITKEKEWVLCAKGTKNKHQIVFVTICLQIITYIINTLQVSHRLFCDCFHKFFCVTFTQIEEFPMHSHLNSLTNKLDSFFKSSDASFVRKLLPQFFLLTISTTFDESLQSRIVHTILLEMIKIRL